MTSSRSTIRFKANSNLLVKSARHPILRLTTAVQATDARILIVSSTRLATTTITARQSERVPPEVFGTTAGNSIVCKELLLVSHVHIPLAEFSSFQVFSNFKGATKSGSIARHVLHGKVSLGIKRKKSDDAARRKFGGI